MVSKNRRLVPALIAVAGLVAIGGAQVPQPKPKLLVNATLVASPTSYSGYCPAVIHFNGKIAVGQPCTVKYRFIRSDGGTGAWASHAFLAAGTTNVQATWTLGAAYSGWEAIEISSPVALKSNQAAFSATCVPRPTITGARLEYQGQPNPEMDIMGQNLGATQGTKTIKVDNAVVSSVIHWDNASATVKFGVPPLTSPPIPWEHTYQISILDGSTVISNVLSKRFPYAIDSLSPNKGLKGGDFAVNVWAIPPAPGGLVLMMDSIACPTTAWGGNQIKAKVPATIAPGTYEVYLKKGGSIVSNKENFTVVKFGGLPIKK
jgi:hypothetical protein